jgi:hypothetical protein
METGKICLECHEPLGAGRPDRRFCSENCRINYHNKEKIYENAEIKKINNILKHNRRTLKKLLGDEYEKIVNREKLLKSGFEFDYYTHHRESKVRKYEYTFCFDYGYREMGDENYKIVKAFEYKED